MAIFKPVLLKRCRSEFVLIYNGSFLAPENGQSWLKHDTSIVYGWLKTYEILTGLSAFKIIAKILHKYDKADHVNASTGFRHHVLVAIFRKITRFAPCRADEAHSLGIRGWRQLKYVAMALRKDNWCSANIKSRLICPSFPPSDNTIVNSVSSWAYAS